MKKHILAFRVVMYVKFFAGLWKQSFLLLLVQLTNFKKQLKKKKVKGAEKYFLLFLFDFLKDKT